MKARARFLGHSIHQILIVFPLGLLSTSFIFDVIGALWKGGFYNIIADQMLRAGIIGAVVAAPFGLLDWMKIPRGTRAKRVGLAHAAANSLGLVLFIISWLLRREDSSIPGQTAIAFSMAGVMLAALGGWFGGELVNRLGVGVDEGAHLDAPSSLSGRDATG